MDKSINKRLEIERMNRINAALGAYAYEIMDDPIYTDEKWDNICRSINPFVKTGRLDDFFADEFDPSTGVWIYKHPEVMGIAAIYQRLTGKPAKNVMPYKNDSAPVTASVSNMGFKTQVEMKWYIASLGFNVVPHWSEHAGRWCKTEFDKECGYITDTKTGEQITIFYKDLFNG